MNQKIRYRLAITYTVILAIILLSFGVGVYYITAESLLDDIDTQLQGVADQISQQTEAVFLQNITMPIVSNEQGLLEVASMLIILVDLDGNILEASANLAGRQALLDKNGLGSEIHIATVEQSQLRLRVVTLPITVTSSEQEQIIGYLQVGMLLDNYYSSLRRLWTILLLAGLGAVTASGLIGINFMPASLKSLNDIAYAALQITRADDLSRRLPDAGKNDEISDLVRALNVTLERLEKLFRTQQRFLADISHELRTPLTTVRGNVDLMRRMGAADPESLDVIKEELERMSRLVGDLLFLARADSGGLPIQQTKFELDTAFLDVYRQVHRLATRVKLELVSVDQIMIVGDPDRIKQVVLILVDNALKYTSAGGKVQMALYREEDAGIIRVTDTGVGIPPDDLPYIFDRFYRVDKARTRAMGGSGLGLSIAKWVVEAHGGTVSVESTLGEGTKFEVRLPALPSEFDETPQPTTPPEENKTRPMLRRFPLLSSTVSCNPSKSCIKWMLRQFTRSRGKLFPKIYRTIICISPIWISFKTGIKATNHRTGNHIRVCPCAISHHIYHIIVGVT